MEGSCYRGGQFNSRRMEGECYRGGHVTELAILMEGLCYRGGQFNSRRMVLLQRRPI